MCYCYPTGCISDRGGHVNLFPGMTIIRGFRYQVPGSLSDAPGPRPRPPRPPRPPPATPAADAADANQMVARFLPMCVAESRRDTYHVESDCAEQPGPVKAGRGAGASAPGEKKNHVSQSQSHGSGSGGRRCDYWLRALSFFVSRFFLLFFSFSAL